MRPALIRLLDQWRALEIFFNEECAVNEPGDEGQGDDDLVNPETVKATLKKFFNRRKTRLYAAFLVKALESADESWHHTHREEEFGEIIPKFAGLFHKACCTEKYCLCVLSTDFTSRYNIKDKKDIVIGTKAMECLALVNNDTASAFYKAVVLFYQAACSYIKDKINPEKEPLWYHAQVADITRRQNSSFASIKYFLERFGCLSDVIDQDELHMEFLNFQSLQDSELPQELFTIPSSKDINEPRPIEDQWNMLGKLTDFNHAPRFKQLEKFMMCILLIPVSNAPCEGVFHC
ncbi:uncharacterized protein LOC141909906 [Tubulanus polymorphus]|uniref:uncharacterized protein LOC141909906 n=1 Tax=Tubulanus polymorphus TaxID=672921 RepID=UPI003DA45FC1